MSVGDAARGEDAIGGSARGDDSRGEAVVVGGDVQGSGGGAVAGGVAGLEDELSEDEEEDDESDGGDDLVLPEDPSSIDPEVLSTLPPSMQLEALLKMREA